MIEIIEKAGRLNESPFTDNCMMYPVFMLKDGKEYFVFNRREPDYSWKKEERKAQIAELIANDGTHFHFHGAYADPFEMLKEMAERDHTFRDPEVFWDCRNNPAYGSGFVDFLGNRNEFSAAFHYRIYDAAFLEKIKEAAAPIIKKSRKEDGR